MRRLRYSVAASLDGFITDARGGFDWIPHDATVDFEAIFQRIDTVVLGRRTYDDVRAMGTPSWKPGTRVHVVSRTLEADDPNVVVVDDPVTLVASLRHEAGSGSVAVRRWWRRNSARCPRPYALARLSIRDGRVTLRRVGGRLLANR